MVSGVFKIREFKTSGDDIKVWLERLENFMLAEYGSDLTNEARKKAILITAIGEDANAAITNFQEQEKDTYEHLKVKLQEYYETKKNDTMHRHEFYTMYQEENEELDDFVNRLKKQALKCNFKVECRPATANEAAVNHDLTDDFIKDRIIVGIHDQSMKRRLMREKNLTLTNAINLAKATEAANKQIRQLTQPGLKLVHANYRHQGPQFNAKPSKMQNTMAKSRTAFKTQSTTPIQKYDQKKKLPACKFCGENHQRGADFCPAYKKKCRGCGKLNHLEKVCFQRGKQQQRGIYDIHHPSYQSDVEFPEYYQNYEYDNPDTPMSTHEQAQFDYEIDDNFEQLEIGLLTIMHIA